MKILLAEDEASIRLQYHLILQERGHEVVSTENGRVCIDAYGMALKVNGSKSQRPPFDVVILDYRMPVLDGLEAAKEILKVCPNQRIIFASAYVQETLVDSIKNLKQIVELLQKPFSLQDLIDTIEDKTIYDDLAKLNVNVQNLKDLNPTHAQIRDYLDALRKIQKAKTF